MKLHVVGQDPQYNAAELNLTQRQASGKFSKNEASALIDQLLAAPGADGDEGPVVSGEEISAADRLSMERADVLRGMPAGLLASELERRGWQVTPPA